MQRPVLDYLNLLHDEKPHHILRTFLDFVDDEPGFKAKPVSDCYGSFEFSDVVELEEDPDRETVEFFKWWIREFRQTVLGKIDALTGLMTRDFWDREIRGSIRSSLDRLTLFMMDIDHFKTINDTHGHQAGDDVLSGVGEILSDHFRHHENVVRYGGEEFLGFGNYDRERRLELTREVRKSVAETQFFSEQVDPITLSIGVSPPHSEGSLEERVREADLALYASKSQGRDRTTVFAPYMRHRRKLWIWGFYRYLWRNDVRFCLKAGGPRFYLYRGGTLVLYSWNENSGEEILLPESLEHPVNRIEPHPQGCLVLDGGGTLWVAGTGGVEPWVRDGGLPRVVAVSNSGETTLAVGINNQLYRLESGEYEQMESFSTKWDEFFYNGDVFYVSGRELHQWDGDEERILTELPAAPHDFAIDDNRLVMSGSKGNLYQFDFEVDHWRQLEFPDLFDEPTRVRSISHRGENYLFKDDSGRLILSRRRSKSVPQNMNISPRPIGVER